MNMRPIAMMLTVAAAMDASAAFAGVIDMRASPANPAGINAPAPLIVSPGNPGIPTTAAGAVLPVVGASPKSAGVHTPAEATGVTVTSQPKVRF